MTTNDETMVIENGQEITPQTSVKQEMTENDNVTWKKVSIGAATGILLGAGALYAVDTLASEDKEEEVNEPLPQNIKVAKIADGPSFDNAFAAARAQVGSGGVFRWNGGIYSTYTEEEWNGMTDKEKADFAYLVRPEVRADEIVAERMAEEASEQQVQLEAVANNSHPHATRTSDVNTNHDNAQSSADETADDLAQHQSTQQSQDTEDNDVHIVGQGTIRGHQAVALDITGNGEADIAIIDWNDNGRLDDPDVMIDRNGNYATIGQLAQAEDGQNPNEGNGYASDTDQNMHDPNMQYTDYSSADDTNVADTYTDGNDDAGVQDDGGFVSL